MLVRDLTEVDDATFAAMMHVKMLYADPDEHPDENRTFMRDFAGGEGFTQERQERETRERRKPSDPGPSPSGKGWGNGSRASAAAQAKPGARPTITIEVGETKRIVDEIEAALLASDLPLYKRGGLIVSPGVSRLPTWNKGKVIAQVILERPPDRLVEDAEAIAQFLKRNKC